MIYSISEIQTYKRCRRKHFYYSSNFQNIEPVIPKPHFALGTLIHKVLGEWIKSPSIDPCDLFLVESNKMLVAFEQEYIARFQMKPSTVELEPLTESLVLGQAMIENYLQYYKVPLPPEYHVFDTEQEITLDIPDTDHQMIMKLDGILQDYSGNLYVLEHKTYSQKPNPLALTMDEQFTAYVWGANQLNIGRVVGLFYNGMWKRPEPPRGRVFEDLFMRQVLHRGRVQLEEFEDELRTSAYEIQHPLTNHVLKTIPWNGCVDCVYSKLCITETMQEDSKYIRDTFFKQKHTREVDDE